MDDFTKQLAAHAANVLADVTVGTKKTVGQIKAERPVTPAPKPGQKVSMKGEVKVSRAKLNEAKDQELRDRAADRIADRMAEADAERANPVPIGFPSKRTARATRAAWLKWQEENPGKEWAPAEKPAKEMTDAELPAPIDITGLVSNDKSGLAKVVLIALNEIEQEPAGDPPIRSFVESIRLHGVVEPIKVRQIEEGRYTIIDGRRRFAAAQLAGLSSIRALVDEREDADEDVTALISNDQRSPNLIDQHRHVSNLIAKGKTVEQIMAATGMTKYQVARARDLGKLNPALIEAVDTGAMPPAVARHAAMLDSDEQKELVKILKSEGRIKSRDVSAIRRKNVHAAVEAAQEIMKERGDIPDLPPAFEDEAVAEGRYAQESEKRLTKAQKWDRAGQLVKEALALLESVKTRSDDQEQVVFLISEAAGRFE